MPTANYLPDVLETTEAERLATGFIFTEGPTWHPEGFWYFVDLRRNQLLRLTPGKEPELVRTTIGGNGTTFDLRGRLIVCEGDALIFGSISSARIDLNRLRVPSSSAPISRE
jgi:sugar lactone lactonase YvrE